MYGSKRIAEYFETLFAYIIVTATAISRNKISINPYKEDFKPKNKNDHNGLSINWIPNNIKNCFLYFCFDNSVFEFQIIYKDKPIRKYNIVHTGPNNQDGGENHGFIKVGNQFDTDEKVKKEPIIPADSQIIIEITNLKIFLDMQTYFFIIYIRSLA